MMNASARPSIWSKVGPGLSLMVLAPLLAEILPGATRFSALFVLPIEMCVWGGGALLIRYAVRRWQLVNTKSRRRKEISDSGGDIVLASRMEDYD